VAKWLLLISSLLFTTNLLAASPDKILYHLNSGRSDVQWKTITNLENLFLGAEEHALDVKILLQGQGINLINKVNENRDIGIRLGELISLGLQIEVSRDNYYKNRHTLDLHHPPQLVSNIFSRIIELQNQGYQYVTP
jgi:intracellular sulfur oxidation DsrE/DsrF family protein